MLNFAIIVQSLVVIDEEEEKNKKKVEETNPSFLPSQFSTWDVLICARHCGP